MQKKAVFKNLVHVEFFFQQRTTLPSGQPQNIQEWKLIQT